MVLGDGCRDRPRAHRARARGRRARTRSSSSPATTAASASPTPGRSRARKTELLEGGVRIPAIVRWPGHVRAGLDVEPDDHVDGLAADVPRGGGRRDRSVIAARWDGPRRRSSAARRAVSRKLYWRYKHNLQQAMRDGDWKYLKILDNTFLFNVVDDPLERANLKERRRDIYDRLAAEWRAWDANDAAARSDVVDRRVRLERARRSHGRARARTRAAQVARSSPGFVTRERIAP